MFCSNCGAKIEDGAQYCSGCGKAVSGEATAKQTDKKANVVTIIFLISPRQTFWNKCHVYRDGKEIVKAEQGATVELQCDKPYEIQVKLDGFFGTAKALVSPGDKYRLEARGLGTIFLSKVDIITGPSYFTFGI
jgi:hypothetical protein